jgi:alpha-1,3-rhamnosyltransferase
MNQEFPLISILVPVYNHAKYIVECLNSLKKQDYPNVEIILCDDGSKDNSIEVIKKMDFE